MTKQAALKLLRSSTSPEEWVANVKTVTASFGSNTPQWYTKEVVNAKLMQKVIGYESHWNYRIMAHEHNNDVYFEIHEVYYKGGVPNGCVTTGATMRGDSIEELTAVHQHLYEALFKPILYAGTKFPQVYPYKKQPGLQSIEDIDAQAHFDKTWKEYDKK